MSSKQLWNGIAVPLFFVYQPIYYAFSVGYCTHTKYIPEHDIMFSKFQVMQLTGRQEEKVPGPAAYHLISGEGGGREKSKARRTGTLSFFGFLNCPVSLCTCFY